MSECRNNEVLRNQRKKSHTMKEYTDLQSHFRSANYTAFIGRRNNFRPDPHNGSKKEKRSYGEVKNNNTMLKILPFIQILYLKQQSSILRCFCRLKFEKSLINNTFFSFIFHSKMISSYS